MTGRLRAVVVCAGVAAALSFAGPAGAASHAGWVKASVPGSIDGLGAISCPTASDCWATAGELLHSQNGGKTWSREKGTPASVAQFETLSCPTAKDCWVDGVTTSEGPGQSMFFHTTNAGKSWSSKTAPDGIAYVDDIFCVDSTHCAALGYGLEVVTTSNGGKTWKKHNLPQPGANAIGLTCVSDGNCWIVGSTTNTEPYLAELTSSGASHLVSTPALPAKGYLKGITCAGAKTCVAVGSNAAQTKAIVISTTDAGKTWHEHSGPKGPGQLTAVACPTAKRCFAVGDHYSKGSSDTVTAYVARTEDLGAKWTVQARYAETTKPTSDGNLATIACATTNVCAAGGSTFGLSGFAIDTHDGG